jgi:hypothetical protein
MPDLINLIYEDKIIGTIQGDTFYKTIDSAKHLLRQPPAIAIQATAIQYCMAHEIRFIEIRDCKSGQTWRCTLNQFLDSKFSFNRGYGEQYALPLDKWNLPDYQVRLFGV